MKRIFAYLLIVCLLMGAIVPGGAEAEEAVKPSLPAQDTVVENLPGLLEEALSAADAEAPALEAPTIDPLPPYTNRNAVKIVGTAGPGSIVKAYVYIRQPGETEPAVWGETETSEQGKYEMTLEFDEGKYELFTTAELNEMVSERSASVVFEVDVTPPSNDMYTEWYNVAYDEILLTWEPPYVENEQGIPMPDPTIVGYVLERADGTPIVETAQTQYIDRGLPEASYVDYKLYAVDRAGNRSDAVGIGAATFHRYATAVEKEESEYFNIPVLSRHGKTIVYRSGHPDRYGIVAYDVESETKTVLVSADSSYTNQGLAVSGDGRYVAFESTSEDDAEPVLNVYDRTTGQTIPIVTADEGRFFALSMSGDGSKLAFVSSSDELTPGDGNGWEDVFLADLSDLADVQIKRLSEGPTGQNPTNRSYNPFISGDGKHVAFVSSAPELVPGGAASGSISRLFLYDIDAGGLSHIPIKDSAEGEPELGVGAPSLSQDGRYIAYVGIGGKKKLAVYDRQTGTDKTIWSGSSNSSLTLASPFVSDDGKFVAVGYTLYNPGSYTAPFLSQFGGLRFNTTDGSYRYIGKLKGRTSDVRLAGDGNRVIFMNDKSAQSASNLYTVCFEACGGGTPSEQGIDRVQWSVPSDAWVSGQLKSGTAIAIRAAGRENLDVEAAVAYREAADGGSGEPVAKELRIDLTEVSPGIYEGVFTIAEGIEQVDAITAKPKDGSSAGKKATGLPVKAAGKLTVHVQTDDGDLLGGAELNVTSGEHFIVIPMEPSVLRYERYLFAGEYELAMISKEGGFALAGEQEISVKNGKATTATLRPVRAALKVTATEAGTVKPIQGARVTFKEKGSGSIVAEVTTNSRGEAELPGEHTVGEQFTASVQAPDDMQNPPEQTVSLRLGVNALRFELVKTADTVKSVAMSFAKQVGKSPNLRPVIDSNATVTVQAMPGLTVKAKVAYTQWADGPDPIPGEKELDLAESASGQYEGLFRITEGMMKIDSIYVQIGGQWLTKANRVDTVVASRLRLNFDYAQGTNWSNAFSGATMAVGYSDKFYNYYYDVKELSADSRTYLIDVPFIQTAPYLLTLKPGDERLLLMQLQATAQRFGKTQDVAVSPKFKIALNGTVKDDKGAAVEVVYILQNQQNEIVANGNANGALSFSFESVANGVYSLKLTPKDPAYSVKTLEIVADSFAKTVDVVLTKKPFGALSGRVYGTDRLPAAGATVTATLVQEGLGKTYTTVTDSNGGYSLQLPKGTIEVRASDNGTRGFLSPAVSVDIPATGGAQADLNLMNDAKLHFKLYTKSQGGNWQGPIDIDGLTAAHMGLVSSHTLTQLGAPFRVRAVAGDTVRICVNGQEGGLPSSCQEAVIGSDNEAAMEIRLEDTGSAAEFTVVQPNGTRLSYVNLVAVELNGGGSLTYGLNPDNVKNVLKLYRPGSYRLTLNGPNGLSATVGFTVNAGQRLDLGAIRLQSADKFNDRNGNYLISTSDHSTPNGRITLRAAYVNTGGSPGRAANAKLLLELPQETEAIPGTLIVNGKAGTMNVSNGIVTVPLGDVDGGARGSVQIQLKTSEQASVQNIFVSARIQYMNETGTHEEYLGMSVIELFPVTLLVPNKTPHRNIQLRGTAPAGEQVTVYDGDTAIGRAAVSPAGTWSMAAELVETGLLKHRLRTETTLKGARVSGQKAVVVYDPDDPGLEEVTMRQVDGRVQTFKSDNGTAIFPYVVRPFAPFVFSLKFRDPRRIYDVNIQMGNGSVAVEPKNGKYTTTMAMPSNLGPIWVTYKTKSLPEEISEPAPSEERVRDEMPDAYRNFQPGWIAVAGERTPDGRTIPAGSTELEAELAGNTFAELGISRSDVDGYAPSRQDLLRAERTGREVYGVSISHSRADDPAALTLTAYFPKNAATQLIGANAKANFAKALAPSAGTVKVLFNLNNLYKTLDSGKKAYSSWKDLQKTLGPSVFDRIDKDIEIAQAICDPQAAQYYTNFANDIKIDIASVEYAKLLMKLTEKLLDKNPLGKLVFWGETQWAGKTLDETIEAELIELEDHLKQYNCKIKPYKEPVADPIYIWDPSGFVYEGYEANVLEGATATALNLDPEAGAWNVWDAEWYGQINPQITDLGGRYGWDVPEGKWKVRYEKEGYETAYSDELDVPPPHFEVNIPMISYVPPTVAYIRAAPGGMKVEVGFNKPVSGELIRSDSIVVENAGGVAAPGAVQLKDPVAVEGGKTLSKVLVYTPEQPLVIGQTYKVTVGADVASYAGVPLGQAYSRTVAIVGADVTPPADIAELTGSLSDRTATLVWKQPEDPDFSAARIRWKKAGTAAYGQAVVVEKGKTWTSVADLDGKAGYQFLVSAVDEYGNESAGISVSLVQEEKVDLAPPGSVQGFAVKPSGASRLEAAWSDPVAADLAKLRLTWIQEGETTGAQSVEVAKGVKSYVIAGLKASTKYKFTIVAIDESGNESGATSLTAETSASGDSTPTPGGGTPGGGKPGGGTSGDGTPPSGGKENPSVKEWNIGAEGGTLDAFEGRLKLLADKNTFQGNTKLSITEQPGSRAALPSGYSRYSAAYLLKGENAELKRPVRLTLAFDPAAAASTDIRRLGIYKKDSASSGGWTYIGGTVNASKLLISVDIEELGEYAVLLYDHPFADLAGHWARKDIDVLVSRHLASGVAPERFEPDRAVTRAEFARLAVQLWRAIGGGDAAPAEAQAQPFADIAAGAWYVATVNEAASLGLLYGANGRFRPNDPVSRQEAAVILARVLGVDPDIKLNTEAVLGRFRDRSAVADWARVSAAYLVQEGLLSGWGGALNPNAVTTRAEAATLLLRVLDAKGRLQER